MSQTTLQSIINMTNHSRESHSTAVQEAFGLNISESA